MGVTLGFTMGCGPSSPAQAAASKMAEAEDMDWCLVIFWDSGHLHTSVITCYVLLADFDICGTCRQFVTMNGVWCYSWLLLFMLLQPCWNAMALSNHTSWWSWVWQKNSMYEGSIIHEYVKDSKKVALSANAGKMSDEAWAARLGATLLFAFL